MYTGEDYHEIQERLANAQRAVNDALLAIHFAEQRVFGAMKEHCHRSRQDLLVVHSRLLKALRLAAAPLAEKPIGDIEGQFEVVMHQIGPKKIQVIKTIREFTGMGLKEAKTLSEQLTPAVMLRTQDKITAEQFAEALSQAGATAFSGHIRGYKV